MATKSETGVTVQSVAGQYLIGEGPHWDHDIQKLYFVDIFGQKICRLDPATGTVTSAYTESGPVGFVIPVDGMPGKFVAGVGRDFSVITWDGESNESNPPIQKLAAVDSEHAGNRWNDGKVDSSGRFWGGTMGAEKDGKFELDKGCAYSISGNNPPKKEIEPVGISNGLAWSLDDDTFYYIDSLSYEVTAYDYNPQSGTICNKRVVFNFKKNNVPGFPDGMTIDTDGNLWIAVYSGGRVIQINPKTGELLRTVMIPAKRVTSVAFGGSNLDTLYVTTARYGMNESELKQEPQAGCLFAVNGLGVCGLKAHSFKLNA